MILDDEDPTAVALKQAIEAGDVTALEALLAADPSRARVRIASPNGQRSLLHLATDWPGHRPRVAEVIAALVRAGAAVGAHFIGMHRETPLHWAASSDDVEAIDALMAAGAALEATGAVIADGTALDDAVAFGQWRAARRLVEHGARTSLRCAAALGLIDRVTELELDATAEERTVALWYAAHGGQLEAARFLVDCGADHGWRGFDGLTALGVARRSGAADVVAWLRARGAPE